MNSFNRLCLKPMTIILFFLLTLPISFADDLSPTGTSSTGYQPQFEVSGNKIYYVWHEYDGSYRQIFTSEMNVDANGCKAEKRTSGHYDKVFPQLQVAENRIYYVRQQPDETKNRQIWTMEMNIDGTGWKEVQRKNKNSNKQFPQLQVIGKAIFYVWNEFDGTSRQIWTAAMNRDGTGWQALKRTSSPQDKHNPQAKVNGRRAFLPWHEADGPDWRKARYQIWTAHMNIDGTGWKAIQRTMAGFDKYTLTFPRKSGHMTKFH